jgi:hypothetical protein
MELTQEYFDQQLKNLATKQDLERFSTKDDLQGLEQRMDKKFATKQDIRDAIEELARITSEGFADLQQRLDVTERVKKIEQKFIKLEEALHIKL